MEMLFVHMITLFISFFILLQSSHWVINSAVKISHIVKLGEVAIGFILLAIATSLPELLIAINSVATNNINMSIGNILGSNIADLTLIIGIAALIGRISLRKEKVTELSTALFITSVILIAILGLSQISNILGIALIGTFFYFAYISIKRKIRITGKIEEPPKMRHHYARYAIKAVMFFVLGTIGIAISSRFLITSSSAIASMIGITEAVVGATLISVGTVLPELFVSIAAVRRGHYGLALGGVIGGTLFKLTLVLGTILLLYPLAINFEIFSTLILFVLLTNLLVWYFITKGTLDKKEGIILIFVYQIFIIAILGIQMFVI